jgi:5-methyltetrahydropteroyltriglutamate--homocysteine methyltransferase
MAGALREAWDSRAATAAWFHGTDPFTVEVLSQLNFDAAVIDCQHGMHEPQDALNQLRALQAMSKATPLVRVSEVNDAQIGRFLDAGFAGIIAPMINTKAEAEKLCAACAYAPFGVRSAGPTRALIKKGGAVGGYVNETLAPATKPIVLAMVETPGGVANVAEILDTDVDGVFIGPLDLSIAMGEPCTGTKGKKTRAAISRIQAQALRKNKIVGIYVPDRESAEEYIARGFQFVVACHDKIALLAGAKASLPQVQQRVRTTHVGSLPRPAWLVPIVRGDEAPPADFAQKLHKATVEVMQKQLDAGIDDINDGELGRKDYVSAARQRLSGFGGQAKAAGASDLVEMKDFSKKHEGRKGLLQLTEKTEVTTASCNGPIEYTAEGLKDLKDEIARVTAAAKELDIPMDRVFFSSPSPGVIANFFGNDFYATHEEYVQALANAMKTEYQTIAEAGFKLQVDCPDLAMGRHTRFAKCTLAEFRKAAQFHVKVMNEALEGLDASKMRIHVCWGNYPGPHHHDVALADVADIIVSAAPKYISIEACNPGHAHEYEIWKDIVVPEDKVFLPGVIDTTTSHIENPRLVAQRLQAYASTFGMNRIMACTDCGFSTAAGALNITEDIVWNKMASMVKGASSLADSKQAQVVHVDDAPELGLALLDAYIPGHERTTTLFFGFIVTNPDDPPMFPESYGYSMTYNAMQPGNGNALHRHPNLEIFVPMDEPFEFAWGTKGEHVVVLRPWDIIAIPAGVTHRYENAADGKQEGRILTVLPGQAAITWDDDVVKKAKDNGCPCSDDGVMLSNKKDGADRRKSISITEAVADIPASKEEGEAYIVRYDSGNKLQRTTADGLLQMSWLHMNRGEIVDIPSSVQTVAILLTGKVNCGEQLKVMDVVKQPSFLSAAEKSIVLLIESALPSGMDFHFAP